MKVTTQILLDAIADKSNKQSRIITLYSFGLEALGKANAEKIEWSEVESAIIDRWSPAALGRITAKAWSIVGT